MNTYRTTPMTESEIRSAAPSVFAQGAHDSRSARYSFISTGEVLKALESEGFGVFKAEQSRCRLADRKEFTKHQIRIRPLTGSNKIQNERGASVFEIVLTNSHDGASGYKLDGGMFRIACANGLVVPDGLGQSQRVRHTGDVTSNVIEGVCHVVGQAKTIADRVETYKEIVVPQAEQLLLASGAIGLRYEEDESPISPQTALSARRWDDKGGDLWTVFNRLQENLVRGGVVGYAQGKRRTVREVKSIDESTKLNKALWALADGYAALRGFVPAEAIAA